MNGAAMAWPLPTQPTLDNLSNPAFWYEYNGRRDKHTCGTMSLIMRRYLIV